MTSHLAAFQFCSPGFIFSSTIQGNLGDCMMDFVEVLDFFGGTIFSEEYRGDDAVINAKLATVKEEAETSVSPTSDQYGRLFLLQGVSALIKGDVTDASYSFLKLAEPASGFPQSWCIRANTYLLPMLGASRFPPMLRSRTEHGGFAGDLAGMQMGFYANYKKLADWLSAFPTDTQSPDNPLEQQILLMMPTVSIHMRAAGHAHHPLFPLPPEFKVSDIEFAQSPWSRMIELSRIAGCAKVERYLDRLTLELEIARGSDNVEERFQRLKEASMTAEDWAGLASLHVLDADRILSPPFTSPVSLNLVAVDSCNATTSNKHWDVIESSIALNESAEASSLYDTAFGMYKTAAASRGCAAVRLRQACIQHVKALRETPGCPAWHKTLDATDEALNEALVLFGDGSADTQIVLTHIILASISRGKTASVKEQARSIGVWGREKTNPTVAQFAGLLMMRFGKRQYMDSARSDMALRCYECAQELFVALGDRYLIFQGSTTQMALYTEMSNHTRSRVLCDDVMTKFRSLLVLFDEIQATSSEREAQMISDVASNMIMDLPPHVNRTLFWADDSKALRDWLHEIRPLDTRLTETVGVRFDETSPTQAVLMRLGRHGAKFSNIMKQRRIDNANFGAYYIAEIESQAFLQDFDEVGARAAMEAFLEGLTGQSSLEHTSVAARELLSIYALFRLGDTLRARQVLDCIPEEKLFCSPPMPSIASNYLWSSGANQKYLWDVDGAEVALNLCVMAGDWSKGRRVLVKVLEVCPGFLDVHDNNRDSDIWHRFLHAGLITEHTGDPTDAFNLLLSAAQLAEARRTHATGEDARKASFSTTDVGEIFQGLSRIALYFADSKPAMPTTDKAFRAAHIKANNWLEMALAFMEQGKARALLDSMLANRSGADGGAFNTCASLVYKQRLYFDLRAMPENTRKASEQKEMGNLKKELESLSALDITAASDVLLDAHSTTRNIIAARELYQSIPPDAVVIEFGFSHRDLITFCINSSGIQDSRISSFSSHDARRLVYSYIQEVSADPSPQRTLKLQSLSEHLSNEILAPFTNHLTNKSHIIFIPSQPALAFPFPALTHSQKSLFLSKAISQAPSLRTLHRLRPTGPSPTTITSPTVSILAKPGSTTTTAKEPPLKLAGIEALAISTLFNQNPPTDAKHTTHSAFTSTLASSDILHLSTHGTLDLRSPWQASISLRTPFRVVDLTQMTHDAPALVFFGACLSGVGKATVGNDVTGFSHAVLSAGAKTYMGALWRVDDLSTMLLVVLFYQGLVGSNGEVGVAELWRRAMVAFYEMDEGEVAGLIGEVEACLDVADGKGWECERFVKKARATLRNLRGRGGGVVCRDPFAWAPFVVVGDGDLRFGV